MAMTKRGPVYYADFRDLDGGRQSLFTRDEAVARALYLRVERLALDGRKVDSRSVRRMAKALRNSHSSRAHSRGVEAPRPSRRVQWHVVLAGARHSQVLDLRASTGLSQKEFWSRIGVTQTTGSRYENGERRVPRPVQILLDIAYGTSKQRQAVLQSIAGSDGDR
jgi:DNA-binding transcriptional regulator YiaG